MTPAIREFSDGLYRFMTNPRGPQDEFCCIRCDNSLIFLRGEVVMNRAAGTPQQKEELK
jgi:hypothetical protein